VFQDLGRAYGIADYEALLGPVKTNEARTKLPAKFPRPDLTRWDDLPANERDQFAHCVTSATSIVPIMASCVFRDRLSIKRRTIVMVTDTPSILGGRFMTGLINGLHDASWQLAGMRQPTAWEHRVSNSRSFFYSTTVAEEHQREQYHLLEPEKAMDVTVRLLETERPLQASKTKNRSPAPGHNNTKSPK